LAKLLQKKMVGAMFEMLGNQFFMVRNYARAAEMLERALWKDAKNKAIQRKLIVCYTQIGKVNKALEVFLSLIKEDIDFIINTDPVDDDCPCPELVFEMENKRDQNESSLDFHLILGMLWLYCDLDQSIKYFQKALAIAPHNAQIKSILSILKARKHREGPFNGKTLGKNSQLPITPNPH